MKATDPAFIRMLEGQRMMEEKTAEALNKLLKNVENKVVRLMIHGLILDSIKHADILQAVVDILKGRVFSEVEKFELDRGLETHIKNEEEMVEGFKEIANKVEDERVKGIISQIIREEERHHQELRELFSLFKSLGDLSEEDWWEYLNKWANFNF
ncbi:MAG: ferritin family protein [Candidatus Bathyarchaeia archaeon]